MKSKRPEPPVKGTETVEEIFLTVGSALSWWEGAEDELMGLFRGLCGDREPTAVEAYVRSGRGTRTTMLKSALERYKKRLTSEEIAKVREAMSALDKLAATRNEIAHGHCSSTRMTINGVVTMSGCYLLPSLNEQGWHERSPRYAHTADSIRSFEKETRRWRGDVMDVSLAIRMREQARVQALSHPARTLAQWMPKVQDGEITEEAAAKGIIEVAGWPDQST